MDFRRYINKMLGFLAFVCFFVFLNNKLINDGTNIDIPVPARSFLKLVFQKL